MLCAPALSPRCEGSILGLGRGSKRKEAVWRARLVLQEFSCGSAVRSLAALSY